MIYVDMPNMPSAYDKHYLDVRNKEVTPVAIHDGSLPLYQGKDVKKLAKAWKISYIDALQRFVPFAIDDAGKQYYLPHDENEE